MCARPVNDGQNCADIVMIVDAGSRYSAVHLQALVCELIEFKRYCSLMLNNFLNLSANLEHLFSGVFRGPLG